MFCKIPISIPLNIETSIPRYFARRYSVRCWYRVPVYSPTKTFKKMTETLAHRCSSESAQLEVFNEYQHDRVIMIVDILYSALSTYNVQKRIDGFENLCVMNVLWKKNVASAYEKW